MAAFTEALVGDEAFGELLPDKVLVLCTSGMEALRGGRLCFTDGINISSLLLSSLVV